MTNNIINLIQEYKIIAIVRQIYGHELLRLAQALWAGGIRLLEVTFDQADPDCLAKTTNAINMLVNEFSEGMKLGAGTVLSVSQAGEAKLAGAEFIVSPNTDKPVIEYCKSNQLVSIPGAMTPTEMVYSVNCGADFVKVFPYSNLGLDYMKAIMAPLHHIKFIATGGVGLNNLEEILKVGFVGAGIGGFLVDKNLIKQGNFSEITKRAIDFVRISCISIDHKS